MLPRLLRRAQGPSYHTTPLGGHRRSARSFSTRLSPSGRRSLYSFGAFLTWTPAFLFFHNHVGQVMWVTGPSMSPFLNTDYNSSTRRDAVLVDMRSPANGLRRGMVVALWSPSNPDNMIVKRIVALEGDIVYTRPPYPFPRETVRQGHVWVEGDHPDDRYTRDSNDYGPVARSLIVGQVQAVVWPWNKMAWVRWQDWKGKNGRVIEAGPEWEGEALPYGLEKK